MNTAGWIAFGIGTFLSLLGIWASRDRLIRDWDSVRDWRAARSARSAQTRINRLNEKLALRRELAASPTKLIAYLGSDIFSGLLLITVIGAIAATSSYFWEWNYVAILLTALALGFLLNLLVDAGSICLGVYELEDLERKTAASIGRLQQVVERGSRKREVESPVPAVEPPL